MYSYSFRIKKAMAINMQHDVTEEKMVIIYKGIICAIDIHCKATESVKSVHFAISISAVLIFLSFLKVSQVFKRVLKDPSSV